jgi:hypothetical protein
MNQAEKKGTGYVSEVLKAVNYLVDKAPGRGELKKSLDKYIAEKIIESYKNGIRAGKKQAGRE